MRVPQFHLKAVLFLIIGLWVCVMVEDGWQGAGYRLRANQPAASQLCKGSWWITIHWGKSTFATPANTSSLACSQGEIPSRLPGTWKHKVRAVAKNSTQVQYLWALIWWVGWWKNACLLPVCLGRDTQCNDKRKKVEKEAINYNV